MLNKPILVTGCLPLLLLAVLLAGCNDRHEQSATEPESSTTPVDATPTAVAVPILDVTTSSVPEGVAAVDVRGDQAVLPSSVPDVGKPGQWVSLSASGQAQPSTKALRWPAQSGELALTVWPQDKLAAFSLLVGDPSKEDLAFTKHLQVPFIRTVRDATQTAIDWAAFDSILDPSSAHFRAWYVVDYTGLPKAAADGELSQVQARVESLRQGVWIGSITEVAQYVQEYATARLENVQNNPATVYFDLKDNLDDHQFYQPLTVKVRLPHGWSGGATRATQAGNECPVSIVAHEGETYALVDVVPDQGTVMVEF